MLPDPAAGVTRTRRTVVHMPLLWPVAVLFGGLVVLDRLALVTARPPRRGLQRDASDLEARHEPISFSSVDGLTLRGAWMTKGALRAGAPTAILVHGWTGNSATMLLLAEPLLAAGVPVLVFDVRRHGRSDDAPFVTIRQFRDDLEQAVRFARERAPARPVVVVGHSLGGAAAVLAASSGVPIDAIALVAAPADLEEVTAGMISDRGLPGRLVTRVLRPFWERRAGARFADMDPEVRGTELRSPVLVAFGDRDERVPPRHARRMARATGGDLVRIPGAGHKDILARPELHAALERFVLEVGEGNAPRSAAGEDFGGDVEVLAAVIRSGNRLLLGRRPREKRHGGLWEFPGGKLVEGETRAEAADRELREELGVRLVRLGRTLHSRRDPGSAFVIHFVEAEIEGDPIAREHEELRWVQLSELDGLDLAPADASFASALEDAS
jgi:mutator protein MutT